MKEKIKQTQAQIFNNNNNKKKISLKILDLDDHLYYTHTQVIQIKKTFFFFNYRVVFAKQSIRENYTHITKTKNFHLYQKKRWYESSDKKEKWWKKYPKMNGNGKSNEIENKVDNV